MVFMTYPILLFSYPVVGGIEGDKYVHE